MAALATNGIKSININKQTDFLVIGQNGFWG
jgi:hypothetical protein